MKKKHSWLLAVTIIVMGLMAACQADASEKDPVQTGSSSGQILRIANNTDPVSLDPQMVNEGASALVNTQMYDTLVTRTHDMEIVPSLATSWERLDDYTIEFKLREDVVFHNGDPLTAQDVYFTMSRAIDSPVAAAILGMIDPDRLNVVDEHTIQIGTVEPFAPLLANLGHSTAFIVSERAVTEAGDNYGNHPVGTGAFEFVGRDRGVNLEFQRFDDYWGEAPQIAGIEYRIIPEPSMRLMALENNEIDIAFGVAPSDVHRIEADPDLTLISRINTAVNYIGINTQKAPFDDVRVRQALNYAVDVDAIIEAILEGLGEPTMGPMAASLPMVSRDVQLYGFDPVRARELLDEAGIEEGYPLNIWTDQNATNRSIVEVVANQLGQVGFDVNIESFEWAAYLDALENQNHDLFIMGWTPVTGDADNALFPLFHSTQWGSPGNRSLFDNAQVDALIEEARTTFDEEQRAELYHQLQNIILEEAPWIFLHNGSSLHASRSNVHGYSVRLNGQQTLRDVYFD